MMLQEHLDLLRRIEWACINPKNALVTKYIGNCPECRNWNDVGHKKNCQLDKAIRDLEGKITFEKLDNRLEEIININKSKVNATLADVERIVEEKWGKYFDIIRKSDNYIQVNSDGSITWGQFSDKVNAACRKLCDLFIDVISAWQNDYIHPQAYSILDNVIQAVKAIREAHEEN